jgi:hypothetical protein
MQLVLVLLGPLLGAPVDLQSQLYRQIKCARRTMARPRPELDLEGGACQKHSVSTRIAQKGLPYIMLVGWLVVPFNVARNPSRASARRSTCGQSGEVSHCTSRDSQMCLPLHKRLKIAR